MKIRLLAASGLVLSGALPGMIAMAAPSASDPVTITNTGSTNTTGYSIALSADGAASYRVLGRVGAPAMLQHGRVPKRLATQVYQDVKAAQPLSKLPVTLVMKSVSFGTSTYLVYEGQRTPDLSAPSTAPGKALAADVAAIAGALHLKNGPRR